MMTFGIDWDDTLSPLVEHACALAREEKGIVAFPEDITSWGYTGNEIIETVSEYYGDPRAYERQHVPTQARFFMRELQERGDVYIITAIPPEFMSMRAAQIKEAFPDFRDDHIIMGSAKNLVKFDVVLDDAPHNILKSCADYPVLLRKPWNHNLSGVLSVNNYEEFLVLVDQIKESLAGNRLVARQPSVIALIGPSGANKSALVRELEKIGLAKKIRTYSSDDASELPKSTTQTVYGERYYSFSEADLEDTLGNGMNAVVAVDICGAMALKRKYQTVLVFCKRNREDMIGNILEKNITNREKQIRLLSLENELKNEKLCHFSVRTERVSEAAKEISEIFN